MIIKDALNLYSKLLKPYSQSPKLDTELIISHVINKTKAYLYTWPEHDLSEINLEEINKHIESRKQGISIAHIIGKAEFWDMTFMVNNHILSPRPDTETIIETALGFFNTSTNYYMLDLGTGSGAIAITLAKLFKKSNIIATDISIEVLNIAKQNARLNSINNIQFKLSNWFSKINCIQKFDLITSNPPYIDIDDVDIESNVRLHEPHLALFSPNQGLHDLYTIIKNSSKYLKHNGILVLEHGHKQGNLIMGELQSHGYRNISIHYDLNGIHRCTSAVW